MTIPAGWRGGTVAVVGLGRSGVAATRLLAREGVRVYASDAATAPPGSAAVELLRALPGVEIELGRHDLAKIRAARGVVVSPGVPPDAAPLTVARSSGVPVLSELDLGWRALPGMRCIAVTGTNGKTTTTALVAQLLRAAGLNAEAAGNIGLPLADLALADTRPQWLAVEVSSFQLHDSPDFAPEIGILTNLAPDHLDRYPDVTSYYADKRLMYRNATDANVWVVNGDDPASLDLVRGVRGRHVRFSVSGPADAWYDRRARSLMLGGSALLPRDALELLGAHNVANALAASLAVHEAGIAPGAIAEGLRTFRPLHHRLETVAETGGVRWINDSKATNVSSTAVAIEAMDRPFVLLLGGRHKGEPYSRLGPLLKAGCRLVIAYGEAGPRIAADLAGAVPLERGGDFADVMRRARQAARPGDAVLLSPACSSYDMFQNYEERGATFERLATGP
ncbi:MAG TPA: UDP-N-acetylmuramoyl-L-alanine--D-glutamate ligase [Gemmatimonadales bacterium]|nr:UDP-N-acetylmuramoyl-L-alanine--D-glutamate ligase [Gemmatimonadales bacterium]